MSPDSNDRATEVAPLREEVEGLRRRQVTMTEETRYEDLTAPAGLIGRNGHGTPPLGRSA